MIASGITRRAFAGLMAAAPAAFSQQQDWVSLFDGSSLKGWKPSENTGSWKVQDGCLFADGPRSHLFYDGPVNGARFRNFELEAEIRSAPRSNSGIFFHTAFQDKGWPAKGFEIQVNNTAEGEGGYKENKKTGSLYGVRNVYKAFAKDGEWFTLRASVRGKNVRIWINGVMLVDFTEPTPPVFAGNNERGRSIDAGTFALQCHDPGSKAWYRSIRVRPLPDSTSTPADAEAPTVDAAYQDILTLGAANYPMVDYHVHLKGELTLERALKQSRRDGLMYGLAINCGKGFTVESNEGARKFMEGMKGQPVYIAMQAEGREWTGMFSKETAALFDYVFTDSMTWTDNRGRRMRTWIPAEVGQIADPQEFMDTLVSRAVGILNNEPVDIYVNPTFIPEVIAKDYDKLWTPERMRKVADAAARNHVAVELNDRYKLPSAAFVKVFKEAGCKFTFGTNNAGAPDLRRSEYGIQMIKECGLKWQDFFVPGLWWPRAVERKPEALRG